MLRTNSKKAMENIRKEIVNSYEAANEYYTFAGRASKSEMFMDWMQGLPTAFPVADDIFLRSAIDFLGNILEETEEEKARYTEDKAEKLACNLLYRELEKGARK